MNLNSFSLQKENLHIYPQVCLAFSKPSSGSRGISSTNMSLYALGFLIQPASSVQQTVRKPGRGFQRTRALWREGTGAAPAQREFGSGGSNLIDCFSVAAVVLNMQHLTFKGLLWSLIQHTCETKENK